MAQKLEIILDFYRILPYHFFYSKVITLALSSSVKLCLLLPLSLQDDLSNTTKTLSKVP